MQNALKMSFGITKRAFTIAVVVTTLAWSVAATFAIAPRVASADTTPAAGSLVKGSLPAVYYVGSDGKRYVFTNDKEYFTWYPDFSTVQTISDTDLAALTIGGNVTYKPGVKMVKITSDPRVYAVAHGGVLRWVSTEAVATALYGANWNTKIDDISDAFFTNYTVGAEIDSASDYVIANEQTNSPTINADKGLGTNTGSLNISLASDNPAGMTVTDNAQGINLLALDVSGAGTITGLTFTRQGPGIAADWANVYLYNGDTRLTSGRSVNSTTNQVVFNGLSIAVSGTTELTLVGDLSNPATVGDAHYFSLVQATDVVASANVGGTFPVTGNQFTISGSQGGSITAGIGSAPSNPSMGQTGAELSEFKLTAGSQEDVSLRRLVITNAGSGQLSNLANLAIDVNGTAVATSPTISGDTATFVFAVPYVIGKGITRVFDVMGDIGPGNRAGVDNFQLYIDQTYDVYATGNTYGSGVAVTDNFTSAVAQTIDISGGQITFASNGPTTGNIPVGANNAVIEKFAITSVNNIEVDDLRMEIDTAKAGAPYAMTANDIASLTSCQVENSDTGAALTNSYDLSQWTNGGNDAFTRVFTDRFDVNAGQTLNMALTCDISSTPPNDMIGVALTGQVDARLDGDIRNLDSNLLVTIADGAIVPTSALTGNPQTISSSGLTVAIASSPSSSTVTKGSTVNALGINFTAGAASDIKVSQLKLQGLIDLSAAATTFGTTSTSTGTVALHNVQDVVQSVTIWDGTTQVGVAESPDLNGGINFTNLAWTIPAGTTKTLTVQTALSNNLPYGTSPNQFVIDMIGLLDGSTANLTAQDNNDNTVTATSTQWNANNVHLQPNTNTTELTPMTSVANTTIVTGTGSGTMQIQLDGDSPVASLVSANTSDNVITRIKFSSVNEAFNVTRLTIANIGTGVGGGDSSRSITSVRLFDENGTLFCSGALDSTDRLRCSNDAGLFTVNGNATITVKADIAQVGSNGTGANSGDAPILALYADTSSQTYPDDIKLVGVSSGTALENANIGGASLTISYTSQGNSGGGPNTVDYVGGNMAIIRKTTPTIATIAGSTSLYSGQQTIYSFSVTAGSNADVSLHKFTMATSMSGTVSMNTFQVYENGSLLDPSLYTVVNGDSAWAAGTDLTTNAHSIVTAGGTFSGDVTVYFKGERVTSAGTTKTYAVKATAAVTGTGNSVNVYLKSDTLPATLTGTIATISAVAGGAFTIWSDNSASVHVATYNGVTNQSADLTYTGTPGNGISADWTNGYLVQTLPSTPQTLSN